MTTELITGLIGGVGLFLLGMRLMTNGLRNAAGPALRNILGKWTKTPIRGLLSGFLITALVQSSSAITVAVIGFVNAGLMSMGQSIGVIYGSNVGTTVTGWIVAAVGMSVKVKALALPLIGIGAMLRLTTGSSRRKHIGDAFAGFGLFFLGIETLQSSFYAIHDSIDLSTISIHGIPGILLFVVIGTVLTFVMQSSSAAMALVLTAAMSNVITLESAAAAVIGTNIGTTTTAGLSVIGATYNAKKVAAAHVLFNFATGLVALLLIPILLHAISLIPIAGRAANVAATLAIFHTFFNVLGVILFLPFTKKFVLLLNKHIGKEFTDLGKPKYIDDNTLSTPSLAMDALFMELGRLGELARAMGQKALTSKFRDKDFIKDRAQFDGLVRAIRKFCVKLQHVNLPETAASRLPLSLRVIQYFRKSVNIIDEVSQEHALLNHQLPDNSYECARNFQREVKNILNVAHTPCSDEFGFLKQYIHGLHDQYQELKEALLEDGANGKIELDRMVALLDYYSHMRMMCDQAIKGTDYWAALRNRDITCANADKENDYSWKPTE